MKPGRKAFSKMPDQRKAASHSRKRHIQRVPSKYEEEQQAIADEMGCDVEDLGECMRCGSPWPAGMKHCPECDWDGINMEGVC